MLDIYNEPLENQKIPAVSNTQQHVMEVCASNMHTLNSGQ